MSDEKTIGVAKLLNKQSDSDRRKRMHREATSLVTLNHGGLPKVLDTNSHHYDDMDYKLFIVTEFIHGPTLSQVEFSKISLEEKIISFKNILEILKYCHHLGILHRDIKPDNIILRDGNPNDPVILDFGLSFNFNDNDDDGLTPSGEHLGNRFLILPEQKVGEAGKRDFKSDITCAVGLFYYFLTGIQPTVLVDEHNRKPHQREEAKEILQKIPDYQLEIINNIFDFGFETVIGKRWQTIESLIEQLDILEQSGPKQDTSSDDLVESIRNHSSKPQFVERQTKYHLFDLVMENVKAVLDKLSKELGTNWGYIQSHNRGKNDDGYSSRLAPSNQILGYSGNTFINTFITGNELVVQIIEEREIKETFRYALEAEIKWDIFQETLRAHYLREIKKVLG